MLKVLQSIRRSENPCPVEGPGMKEQNTPSPAERRRHRVARFARGFLSAILGRPKLSLSLVALIVSLLWVGWAAWWGRHAIHSPGPVALAHERLDCSACHVTPWQPIKRLTADDLRMVRQAMDQA